MPQQSQRRSKAKSRRTGGRSKSPKSKAVETNKPGQTVAARLRFTSAELCAVFVAFLLAGAFLMTLSEN